MFSDKNAAYIVDTWLYIPSNKLLYADCTTFVSSVIFKVFVMRSTSPSSSLLIVDLCFLLTQVALDHF